MRQDGRTELVALCDEHYAAAIQQRGFSASPLESLLGRGGGLFEQFFGGDSSFLSMFASRAARCGGCRSDGSARAKRLTCSRS